jgi:hypothetical protein
LLLGVSSFIEADLGRFQSLEKKPGRSLSGQEAVFVLLFWEYLFSVDNKSMDFQAIWEKANADWLAKRASFSKEELAYLAYQDTFRHRLEGFMTRVYYQRKKMILQSDLFLAYAFQDYSNDPASPSYPTWLLFSPSSEVNQNPVFLKEISAKVLSIKGKEHLPKEEETLRKLVEEPLSDCAFVEIPASLSGGHLVYLSIVYVHPERIPSFHLGLALICSAPSLSKEVIYLPLNFYPEELKNAYIKGDFIC